MIFENEFVRDISQTQNDMFQEVTKIIHQLKCTRQAHFNDGREPLIEELVIDSEVALEGFKRNVQEWNRLGEVMKGIPSKSHVQGYNYWMTDDQLKHNQTVTHQRVNKLEWV